MPTKEITLVLIASWLLCGWGEAFESKMTDEEFALRSQEHDGDGRGRIPLPASELPAVGSIIGMIVKDSIAEGLGISTDDILTKVGKKKLWGNIPWTDREAPVDLYGFTKKGEKFSHRIEPGKIGVYNYPYLAPENAFLRKYTDSNDAWVELAARAISFWRSDPELSREAWARALAAGYPEDEYSDFYRLQNSLSEGDTSLYLDRFMNHFPRGTSVPLHFFEGVVWAAIASGEYKHLWTLAKQEPDSFPWTADELTQLAAYAKVDRNQGDLLEKVRSMDHQIMGGDLIVPEQFRRTAFVSEPHCFTAQTNRITRRPGTLFKSVAKEPAPAKNIHMTLIIENIERFESKSLASYFHLGFIAGDYDGTKARTMFFPPNNMSLLKAGVQFKRVNRVGKWVPRFVFSSSGNEAEWEAPFVPYFSERDLMFDLIRLDGEVACYVNGLCTARMPVDPEIDDVSVYLTLTGCSLNGMQCVVRRLLP